MLKKIICFILSMTMGLALCACGAEQGEISEESTVAETARMQESSEQTPEESENTTETESLTSDENHVLVAYFTWSGNTKRASLQKLSEMKINVPKSQIFPNRLTNMTRF